MRPRIVDWTLFLLVSLATLSGFASFLVGRPEGWWVFALHGAGGLAIVLVLVWKMRRVWPRLARPQRWDRATVASLLTLLAVILVLATGVIWSTWQWPAQFPNGLWWHIALGLALTLFLLFHVVLRFKPLQRNDLRDRRAFLHLAGIGLSGLLLWGGNQAFNRAVGTPGDRRRFTGSRNAGEHFPVTMWMFDNPAPIDISTWRLRIRGAVAQEYTVDYATLAALAPDQQAAILDCTSGWYTSQLWRGVTIGRLLAQAQPNAGVVAVSFKSITGYRWSLPLGEAYAALLATHVGDTLLTHGHGAPVRLVAPGRRGFQWVKWVIEIEVLTQPDPGQWRAIFLSGFWS